MATIHTQYLYTVLDKKSLAAALIDATKNLANVEFDAIAVSGNSGTLFGGALAHAMGKDLILVRKAGEASHAGLSSQEVVEGFDGGQSYIIVDDFFSSGATLVRMHRALSAAGMSSHMRFAGIYSYRDREFWSPQAWDSSIRYSSYRAEQWARYRGLIK